MTQPKPIAASLDDLLARAAAFLDRKLAEEPVAPPPVPNRDFGAECMAMRLRALGGHGWGARTLRMATAPTYDETRTARYLEALRAGDGGATGRIVILAGQPGSGKTAACARWAATRPGPGAMGRFLTPRFLAASEFFRASRYQRDGDEDGGRLTRDQILAFETLVLDDLGTEYADANGNYRVDIDELANAFYEDDRTLVITTNLLYASPKAREAIKARGTTVDDTAQTFAERYGERIIDRVRECGRWVDSSSESMRVPPAGGGR